MNGAAIGAFIRAVMRNRILPPLLAACLAAPVAAGEAEAPGPARGGPVASWTIRGGIDGRVEGETIVASDDGTYVFPDHRPLALAPADQALLAKMLTATIGIEQPKLSGITVCDGF